MIDKIQNLIEQYNNLSDEMSRPNAMSDMKHYAKIAKKYKSLDDIVNKGKKYISLKNQLKEYEEAISGSDEELKELIKDDIPQIKLEIDNLRQKLKILSSSES